MERISMPAIPLKVFILLHFMFTSWAQAVYWLGPGYTFCNLVVILFGIWAIIQPDSHDANQLFLIAVIFAIVSDSVLIGINFSSDGNSHSSRLRFAVSFAFFNLFLKPITAIFILVGYQNNIGGFDYTPTISSGHQEYQNLPTGHGQSAS